MPTIHNCRIKMDVKATRWEKMGDHPNVQRVPDHFNVNINGVTDRELLGMIVREDGQAQFFKGPMWIMDTGMASFVVEDDYFEAFYEILPEVEVPVSVIE